MRIEVTYNAEQFVQSCFGEGIESAKEYVKKHPKEKYGADDFAEVYRMQEIKQKARYGSEEHSYDGWYTSGWKEDDISFDRAIKAWEDECQRFGYF